MFCAAMTKKNTPCKKGIRTGSSVYLNGYVYYLCGGKGHTPDNHGPLSEERRTRFTGVAVINDDEGVTNINLATGEENTQLTLDTNKEESTMDTIEVNVRPVVEERSDKLMTLPAAFRYVGTMEGFKLRSRERLTTSPSNIIGFCARMGNRILLVTEEKSVIVEKTVATLPGTARTSNRNARNRPEGQGTKVEREPGYVCGKCSTFDNKVRHNTMDDVRSCYEGKSVPVVG